VIFKIHNRDSPENQITGFGFTTMVSKLLKKIKKPNPKNCLFINQFFQEKKNRKSFKLFFKMTEVAQFFDSDFFKEPELMVLRF
jgi:hypothetical protein